MRCNFAYWIVVLIISTFLTSLWVPEYLGWYREVDPYKWSNWIPHNASVVEATQMTVPCCDMFCSEDIVPDAKKCYKYTNGVCYDNCSKLTCWNFCTPIVKCNTTTTFVVFNVNGNNVTYYINNITESYHRIWYQRKNINCISTDVPIDLNINKDVPNFGHLLMPIIFVMLLCLHIVI
jgi:hypothetical protein